MAQLLGEMLTHDQCWEEYFARSLGGSNYYFESGMDAKQICACECKDTAFEMMEAEEADQERRMMEWYADRGDTFELVGEYYQTHHLKPVTRAYWQVCVDKIEAALR
jgi:hypothetical protein